MIQPDNLSDETLEYAAQLVEQSSLLDIAGSMARRKRDREDAALRAQARQELRAEMAAHIRAMMARPELSAIAVLRRMNLLEDDFDHVATLRDAWPLAWKGWVKITVSITCNDNTIPPEAHYRISLTERGREVLSAQKPA